jgi:hypothetical protein
MLTYAEVYAGAEGRFPETVHRVLGVVLVSMRRREMYCWPATHG